MIRSARKTESCRWGSQGLGDNYDNLGRGYYELFGEGMCNPKHDITNLIIDVSIMRIGDGHQYTGY